MSSVAFQYKITRHYREGGGGSPYREFHYGGLAQSHSDILKAVLQLNSICLLYLFYSLLSRVRVNFLCISNFKVNDLNRLRAVGFRSASQVIW